MNLVLISICTILFFVSPQELTKRWTTTDKLSLIDVGQGSANIIELKGGYRILIDGGGNWFSRATLGERVIAPFLWKKGIQKIDTIYISHGDADHYNGLLFIIDHFAVDKVVIPSAEYYGPHFKGFLDTIKSQNIEIMHKSEVHQYGESRISCVENFAINHKLPVMRNKGLVLQLITPVTRVLFPGDIHKEQEAIIAQHDVESQILISPHHGSKTSSTQEFLENVAPEIILISSGYKSAFFPATEVKNRMNNMDIPFYTTAKHGSLELILKKGYTLEAIQSRSYNPLIDSPTEVLFERLQEKNQDSKASSI